jgi:hypothetical protein
VDDETTGKKWVPAESDSLDRFGLLGLRCRESQYGKKEGKSKVFWRNLNL